jgi:hypothetical protein
MTQPKHVPRGSVRRTVAGDQQLAARHRRDVSRLNAPSGVVLASGRDNSAVRQGVTVDGTPFF